VALAPKRLHHGVVEIDMPTNEGRVGRDQGAVEVHVGSVVEPAL